MKEQAIDKAESRLGKVGGQAVMEGVMMRSGGNVAISVRTSDGRIISRTKKFISVKERIKILGLPVIRGIVNFVEMLVLSMSTLNDSAAMLEESGDIDTTGNKVNPETDEQSDSTDNTTGTKTAVKDKNPASTTAATIIGAVLGLAISFGLFFYLPTFIGNAVRGIVDIGRGVGIIEGIVRILIFMVYLSLVSLLKEIRRTFEYHGAEHMSVFCYESGQELNVENVRKFSRFHPRCGTSFMIIMMLIGVLISLIIPPEFGTIPRTLIKLAIFPIVLGIGYEFIRFAGAHDNILVRIVSAPGIWVQRLTTKKPTDEQLEVAIKSLQAAVTAADADEKAAL